MSEVELVGSCSSCQDHTVLCANRVRATLCPLGFACCLEVKCDDFGFADK